MSEEVRPMVCQNAVMGSDALPRRYSLGLSEGTLLKATCAYLRPEVTGRTQELSLFTQTRDHSQR
jgi:hypothetical protein